MSRAPLLPIAIDVAGARIVMIGGGGVALRKTRTLLQHGANVVVVAPSVADEFNALEGRLEIVRRDFSEDDVADARLVFAATNDHEVNQAVAAAARRRLIPVNVADAPELCDFTLPAVVERGEIRIAVMTGGASPALAQQIRADVERAIGPEYALLNAILAFVRGPAKATIADPVSRRQFFHAIASTKLLDAIARSDAPAVVRLVSEEFGQRGAPAPSDLPHFIEVLLRP